MTTSSAAGPALWEDKEVMTVFRPILLIICASIGLLLGGCSSIKLAYNQAPRLGYWWADGAFDFNDAQVPAVKDKLATLHQRHRQQALPQYLETLQQAQSLVDKTVSPAQICGLYGQAFAHVQKLGDTLAQDLAEVALSLSAKQLKHFGQQREKNLRKWREEWLQPSLEDRQEKRLDQLTDRAESLYGSLDSAQITLLRQGVQRSGEDPSRTEAEQMRRNQDTLEVLRSMQRDSANSPMDERLSLAQRELQALVVRSLRSPDPLYRAYAEQLTQHNCELFSALHNSTSAKQKRKAKQVLEGYEADIRKLMQTPN